MRIYYGFLIIALGLFLSGCKEDETLMSGNINSYGLSFFGTVEDGEELSTRAVSATDISSSYFNCDFYIKIAGRNGLDEEKENWSVLNIPSGASGTLVVTDDSYPKLNWFSRDKNHNYWSWTMPWTSEYDPRDLSVPDKVMVPFPGSSMSELSYSTIGSTVYINWKTGVWKDGEVMEKFVGASAGPLDYLSNGQFVNLKFRHLVSKIFISNFVVVDNVAGTSNSNLRGEITFYGLPNEVPLYTSPVDVDGTIGRPYIPKPEEYGWDYDQSRGVTYVIINKSYTYQWQGGNISARDCFYIPPEIDLSKLSFKIQIYEYVSNNWVESTSHGIHGAYYGDFSRVSFSRTTNGNNYDNYPYDGDDLTRLHAGEYLILNINLYENGEPSIRGTITNWRSWQDRDASQHVEDGIYSIEDMKEFNDLMSSTNVNEEKVQKREDYFQNHGGHTTDEDLAGLYPEYPSQKKVIKLYDDIGISDAHYSTSDNKMSSLYVADDFILDGQGHTVNMNSSSVSIGQVRDIYLRYYYRTSSSPYVYTEYIVYIDKMGEVFLVDPVTFEETPAGYNVNNMTKNPFSIDLSNGRLS